MVSEAPAHLYTSLCILHKQLHHPSTHISTLVHALLEVEAPPLPSALWSARAAPLHEHRGHAQWPWGWLWRWHFTYR